MVWFLCSCTCFVADLPWWSNFTSCFFNFFNSTIICRCPCNFSFQVIFHLVIPLIKNRKRKPKAKCHIKKIRLSCLQLRMVLVNWFGKETEITCQSNNSAIKILKKTRDSRSLIGFFIRYSKHSLICSLTSWQKGKIYNNVSRRK